VKERWLEKLQPKPPRQQSTEKGGCPASPRGPQQRTENAGDTRDPAMEEEQERRGDADEGTAQHSVCGSGGIEDHPGSYLDTSRYYAHFSPGDLNADGRDDWMVGDSSGVHLFFGTEN
jgi:hypothetical protein